jgi:hypothetical protein
MLALPVGGVTKGSSPCHAATLKRHRTVTLPHHHTATRSHRHTIASSPHHAATPSHRHIVSMSHRRIVSLSHRCLVASLQHLAKDGHAVARRNSRLVSSHRCSAFGGQTLLLHRDDTSPQLHCSALSMIAAMSLLHFWIFTLQASRCLCCGGHHLS